jgi:hypothetical protein
VLSGSHWVSLIFKGHVITIKGLRRAAGANRKSWFLISEKRSCKTICVRV